MQIAVSQHTAKHKVPNERRTRTQQLCCSLVSRNGNWSNLQLWATEMDRIADVLPLRVKL